MHVGRRFLTLIPVFALVNSVGVVIALAAGAPGPDFSQADQLIETAIDRGLTPGAVLLVGQGDRVLYRRAYGYRSVQPHREAMTVDTVFDLASLSKPVGCATSVMLLAE